MKHEKNTTERKNKQSRKTGTATKTGKNTKDGKKTFSGSSKNSFSSDSNFGKKKFSSPPPKKNFGIENKPEKKKSSDNQEMRIGRFLSALGLCSRRESDSFLLEHEVMYKGRRITALNFYLPTTALLQIDKKEYRLENNTQVYLLNKPAGYICSHKSFKDQPSIFTLLPQEISRYFFAGRLDADSDGLVVVTNDGDLVYSLTHPSQKTRKLYLVHSSRPLSLSEQDKLLKGVFRRGEKLKADSIKKGKQPAHYFVELHSGKNREVRRLFEAVHVRVLKLTRLRMGEFSLDDIEEGKWRKL